MRMWLLDANMDVHLRSLLLEKGIAAESASCRGWATLKNGALVTEAVGAGFDCLLTRDVLFAEAAARALQRFPNFAVVVVTLQQSPWLRYRESFLAAWDKSPIVPVPGRLVQWPTSRK